MLMMILTVMLAILLVLVAVALAAVMKLDALCVWFAVVLWHVVLFVVLVSCSYFSDLLEPETRWVLEPV